MTVRVMIYLNRVLQSIKKFNKTIVILLISLALAAVFACGCKQTVKPVVYEPNTAFPQEFTGLIADKKVFVTSIGQSVEMNILVRNMETVQGINYTADSLLGVDEVERGSVVFIVVGCSLKSLTESNLTKESEMVRAHEFVEGAKAGDFTLVCWHIGGTARRGETSDSFIEYLFKKCALALFKFDGNLDLKLSDWATAGGVPYVQMNDGTAGVLKLLAGYEDV